MTDYTKLIEILDKLVEYDDILPVRVSPQHMAQGKKNFPGGCPGVLGILDKLQDDSECEDMSSVSVRVGHRTKDHFQNRVVIKVDAEPNYKWIAWIQIESGKSGFHPEKFDKGKQRSPGAMMLYGWSRETVEPMSQEQKDKLTSEEYRLMNKKHRESLPDQGNRRVYYK